MKAMYILAIFFIYSSAQGITWKAVVKDFKGNEQVFKLSNKREKIKIPKSEWHCWVSDIKSKILEGFDSEGRRIDCLLGRSMASVPLFCLKGGVKAKQATMLLNDSKEVKNRVLLTCE